MKKPDILYEDETCIVINKPPFLAVQGGKNVGQSVDGLFKAGFGCTAGDGGTVNRPLLVHRLDKDTSGVLLAAKGPVNAAWYSRQIANGGTVKRYCAVCAEGGGIFKPEQPLRDSGRIGVGLVIQGKEKKAGTKYRLCTTGSVTVDGAASDEARRGKTVVRFSVLELELETGRTHQIRRHLQMIGRPILGDDKYGDFRLNRLLKKTMGLRRLLLHAHFLSIRLKTGAPLEVRAPLPPDFNPYGNTD
ncbi:MAG: RluA family pseudouridine synthase [Spirochaetaceae bacterium]|jgi:23S rRNA pseudouridine955/2504/2580 synthase|nr:RluA family pseudouridine synthase [Spirochaetaceae bacterium]